MGFVGARDFGALYGKNRNSNFTKKTGKNKAGIAGFIGVDQVLNLLILELSDKLYRIQSWVSRVTTTANYAVTRSAKGTC